VRSSGDPEQLGLELLGDVEEGDMGGSESSSSSDSSLSSENTSAPVKT
jgi:hypothetical protein